MNSKEGHGGLFDEILLNTQGLGNDPYESASFRIQKNRLYRYDMLWRLNEYYNPALTISEGRHFRDTSRRMQDHDLILLPQSKVQFRFGYSRNNQDGPALSTVQLFDSRGDEFARFTYVGARRDFVLLENAVGVQRSAITRQTVIGGNATRPTTAGDLSLSLFPTDRLSVVNNTSVYNARIDGSSAFSEVNNAVASTQLLYFH